LLIRFAWPWRSRMRTPLSAIEAMALSPLFPVDKNVTKFAESQRGLL
jgi:hypothetical protein